MEKMKITTFTSMSKLCNVFHQKMKRTNNIFKAPVRTYCCEVSLRKKNISQSVRGGMFSQDDHCPYCKGKKSIRCLDCLGCGRQYYDGMKEHICDGCHGYGYKKCDFCGGSGENYML